MFWLTGSTGNCLVGNKLSYDSKTIVRKRKIISIENDKRNCVPFSMK